MKKLKHQNSAVRLGVTFGESKAQEIEKEVSLCEDVGSSSPCYASAEAIAQELFRRRYFIRI